MSRNTCQKNVTFNQRSNPFSFLLKLHFSVLFKHPCETYGIAKFTPNIIQNSCLVRLFVTKELESKKIGSSVSYSLIIMSRCEQVCLSLFCLGAPPNIL